MPNRTFWIAVVVQLIIIVALFELVPHFVMSHGGLQCLVNPSCNASAQIAGCK